MTINANNRPSLALSIPLIDATIVIPALIADKKMRIKSAKLVQEGIINASAVNYLTYQLKVNNVLVGASVDTQLGVAVRTPIELDLDADYIDLEKGDYLALSAIETAAYADGGLGVLILDIEVIGN